MVTVWHYPVTSKFPEPYITQFPLQDAMDTWVNVIHPTTDQRLCFMRVDMFPTKQKAIDNRIEFIHSQLDEWTKYEIALLEERNKK